MKLNRKELYSNVVTLQYSIKRHNIMLVQTDNIIKI